MSFNLSNIFSMNKITNYSKFFINYLFGNLMKNKY